MIMGFITKFSGTHQMWHVSSDTSAFAPHCFEVAEIGSAYEGGVGIIIFFKNLSEPTSVNYLGFLARSKHYVFLPS